jgi:uncharacterized protein (UPF0333 family)
MRGQTAFEYLMIFSIVLILVVILTAYSGQLTKRNEEDIRISNAIAAVNKITEAANIVNTQGKPSLLTLSVYIPEEVDSITFSGNVILIKVRIASGLSDIFARSKATLQGSISTTSGMKKIKVIAEDNYVNITEG